ncbi:DUF3710 domain-containing protein [Kineococcus terrestris]|uniref:DUF3710 domain-containing protein n=1 Tax=Kineococcus terrestris TaxID=2044856 RepID=UPI0034DB08BB
MSLFRRRNKAADTGSATSAGPAADSPAGTPVGERSVTTAESSAEPATAAAGAVRDPEAEAAAAAVREPATGAATTGSASGTFDRSAGPFDVAEVDEDDTRLPLGGLRLKGRDGMELRFEVEEATGRVIAVTVGLGGSTVQLQVFAAPRTSGVWDEVREEIATAVTRQGGAAEEVAGAFGTELLCRLPVRTQDGRTAHQPTRFAGIDGPRWFLRAVFSGHAAHDAAAAAPLEAVVRDAVVVRGSEAMAPRELVPLALPQVPGGAQPAPGQEAQPAGAGGPQGGQRPRTDDLKPFERGPEITEVR